MNEWMVQAQHGGEMMERPVALSIRRKAELLIILRRHIQVPQLFEVFPWSLEIMIRGPRHQLTPHSVRKP